MSDIILIDETEFTEQELAMANNLVGQIDIFDHDLVLNYGIEPQKKLSSSADKVLKQVKMKNTSSVESAFDSLTSTFNSLRTDKASLNSPIGFIKRNAINTLIVDFNNVRKYVEEIIMQLREHQLAIMQDMDVLRKILKYNKRYYKEISLYILAGQKRILYYEEKVLPELKSKASSSTLNAEDYSRTCEALETFRKRIHNLAVSRTVVMQTIAQVQLLLSTDASVLERINTIIHITVPLFKTQISIDSIVSAKTTINNLKNSR